MFSQLEELMLRPVVQKLNSDGVNVDMLTLKQAIASSPQVVAKITAIMAANPKDRAQRLRDAINEAIGADTSTEHTKRTVTLDAAKMKDTKTEETGKSHPTKRR